MIMKKLFGRRTPTLVAAVLGVGLAFPVAAISTTVSAATKPINLTLMIGNFGPTPNADLIKYLIEPYEKTHPSVKITPEFITGGQSPIDEKTLLDVNAGDPPNMVAVFGNEATLAEKHVLEPLTGFYRQHKITPSDFIPAAWKETLVNGVPYAFPATSNPAAGLWYNPAAMKAAGLNPNDPPKTWAQVLADSAKAVKFGKNGAIEREGLEFGPHSVGTLFPSLADNLSGTNSLWKKVGNQWIPTPVNATNIKDMEYVKKLVAVEGGWSKLSAWLSADEGQGGPIDYLAEGKVLFDVSGFYNFLGYDKYFPSFRYKATYLPTPKGLLSEQFGNPEFSWNIAFPKGQSVANLKAAETFVLWAFDQHSYNLGPTTNGSTVLSQQKLWANELVQKYLPASHKYFAPELKYFSSGVVKYITAPTVTEPIALYYQTQLDDAMEAVLYGKTTPKKALETVAKNVRTEETVSGGA